jgi:hypothetical protein
VSDNSSFGFDIIVGGTIVPGGGAADNASFDGIVYFVGAVVKELSMVIERVGAVAQAPTVNELFTLPAEVNGVYLGTNRAGVKSLIRSLPIKMPVSKCFSGMRMV